MKIAIDIGHARATGARGHGLEEHAVAEWLAEDLSAALTRAGHEVGVIDFPNLSNKADFIATVDVINSERYDLSISLHCDSSDNASAKGAHVIYTSTRGEVYATAIARHLCALLPGRANKTVRRSNLYVLNNTRCPAVLVECGFISNADDARVLREQPESIAAAIAAGIQDIAEGK